ncbi:MAG TPA: hypothetical protein PLO31_02125 [Dysgonamonadaceae bacterium]|nr:hypothetical protein [Dysgonamonadaceae bacterium]
MNRKNSRNLFYTFSLPFVLGIGVTGSTQLLPDTARFSDSSLLFAEVVSPVFIDNTVFFAFSSLLLRSSFALPSLHACL